MKQKGAKRERKGNEMKIKECRSQRPHGKQQNRTSVNLHFDSTFDAFFTLKRTLSPLAHSHCVVSNIAHWRLEFNFILGNCQEVETPTNKSSTGRNESELEFEIWIVLAELSKLQGQLNEDSSASYVEPEEDIFPSSIQRSFKQFKVFFCNITFHSPK